ncbi:MAG TPA: SGNH/GDSL hydrolase family protein [Gammaproteobacteria bacterium]|nr:SGNH/GDSL hydrolase family protein [Gammaproteobacteria bacterium]
MQDNVEPRKKVIFYSIVFLVFVIIAELTSYFGIYVYGIAFPGTPILTTSEIYSQQTKQIRQLLNRKKTRENIHPVLGWNMVPGYQTEQDQVNALGLRSHHEYSKVPAKNIIRIAAFGDSFTYGVEVPNQSAWSTMVEKNYPNVEILNYGVPGYGTDQAYLRYKLEGKKLAPQVVIIGFAPIDLRRSVNRYRRFMSPLEIVFFKPRFILNDKEEIVLLETPIKGKSDYKKLIKNPKMILQAGKNDQWYEAAVYENPLYDFSATIRLATTLWLRIYNRYLDKNRILNGDIFNTNAEAFKVQTKLLERFVDDIKKDNMLPVVVVLPSEIMLKDVKSGKSKVYQPVVSYLLEKNIWVEDLMDEFLGRNATTGIWFMEGGHYSPAGNKVFAEWLGDKISSGKLREKLNYLKKID